MPYPRRVTFQKWRRCDRCGFYYPTNELRRDYTGALVCEKDYFEKGFNERKAEMELPLEGDIDEFGGDVL